MKTFVLLLLLTNLAYFGWNQGWLRAVPPVEPVATPDASAAVEPALPPFQQAPASLALLAELPEPAESGTDAGVDAAMAVPAAAQPVAETGGLIRRDIAAAATEAPVNAPVNPEVATNSNAATNTNTDSNAGTGSNAEITPATPLEPPAIPATPTPWCGELGLITEESAAKALIPDLSALGFAVELQSGRVQVSSTFWVYMPPFASEAEAFRQLEELQERRIDSYYMRSGNWAGGISLGVFSREESAKVAQANLARQGYQAQIGEVFREEPRFRLVLTTQDDSILDGSQWQGFRTRNNTLQLSENVCEVVASASRVP